MTELRNRSIGVFDSGIGGLTVVRELIKRLPYENIIYFGDTARVPYGSKSAEVVRQYALEDARLLINFGVKMIVVACNTASAIAIDDIAQRYGIPTIGVIIPGAHTAAATSKTRRIGVIGTRATIGADTYARQLHLIDKGFHVVSEPCPLFVPLAEEGWEDHVVARHIADEYLAPLKRANVDTLILGCTHYPILKNVIQQSIGNEVNLIDSGQSAAGEVDQLLAELQYKNDSNVAPNYQFIVSDIPQKFQDIAERFLGMPIGRVIKMDASIH